MNGFTLFDTVHMSWLISIFVVLLCSIYFYSKLSSIHQLRYQQIIFWLLLLLECTKQIFLIVTKQYSYWSPPLHLCGLGIFIAGWHAYRPSRTTSTLLYALTLPGAVIALIFPGWTADSGFLHIHSFLFHALLVLFVSPLIRARQLTLSWRDLWRAVLFLLLTVPVIYVYNATFQTNFMFLNRPVAHTPLQWLYETFGASSYIASLAGVVLLLWIMLYIPIKEQKS